MLKECLRVISDREWILTNGRGGYALSFGNMRNKRKYNGLLIASNDNYKRNHILSSIEEKVECENSHFFLDTNHYSNCIYPNGSEHIVRGWMRPYPAVLYSTNPFDERYLIFKEILMPKGLNAVIVKYTNFSANVLGLTLRPKFSMRDHHGLNESGTCDRVTLGKEISDDCAHITRPDNGIESFIYVSEGDIIGTDLSYKSVYYPLEAVRGYDSVEELFAPVRIDCLIKPGKSFSLLVSSEKVDDPNELISKTEAYYKEFPLPKSHPNRMAPKAILEQTSEREFEISEYKKIVQMAAEDFVVNNDDIIAGYPWFGTWSRDTLMALEGLLCLKDGSKRAKAILGKYAASIKDGMLPNTFGEGGEGLNYDTVDAPLWYVLRCYETDPTDKELIAASSNIVLEYFYSDSHPFFVDKDGLVAIREGDYALTWMDAKIYGTPVTPRFGKPVEINALWYNALCCIKEMLNKTKSKEIFSTKYRLSVPALDELIAKVGVSMQKFVSAGFLADRLEHNEPVNEVRPNAVIALSLPFDFVSKEVIKQCWEKAKAELLTAYGLRSLEPANPAFKQKYLGSQKVRDLAYHQGTVWAFLMLPFVNLTLKVFKDDPEFLKKEIAGYVWAIRDAFIKCELASVAEVWDGLDPFFHKGCPAQAWSVFAILKIEDILDKMES